MPSDLILPDRLAPSNLHLRPTTRATFVENDVYDIAKRVARIDRRLYILQLDDADADKCAWAVMERCDDGVERLVYKAKALDAHIVTKLEELMSVPLHERIRRAEAQCRKWDDEQHELMHEELYERLGRPMWGQLEHDGFIGPRPVSYPKSGVVGGRGSLKRSG